MKKVLNTYRNGPDSALTELAVERGCLGITLTLEQPGMTTGLHAHVDQHLSVILAGKAMMNLGGVCSPMSAGESCVVPAGVNHEFTSLDFDTKIKCHFTDKPYDPDDFEVGCLPIELQQRLTQEPA